MTGTHQGATAGWFHPNSLEATADPATQARIKRGRAQARRDQQLFDRWADHGFTSSAQEDRDW